MGGGPGIDVVPRRHALLRRVILRLSVLAGLLLVWQVAATVTNTIWFPPLTAVIRRTEQLVETGRLEASLLGSLGTLGLGYALAVVVGVTTGTAMALSRWVDSALRIYVDAGLFVPPVVFAPVFFAFFGTSNWTLVSVVYIFSVFVIVVSTQTAVSGAQPHLREMAISYGASRLSLVREVTLRGAAPMIFSGLQLGMGRAVKGLIVGEIVVAVVGLGSLERQLSGSFDSAGIWGIALIVIALALALTSAIGVVDRAINSWAYER